MKKFLGIITTILALSGSSVVGAQQLEEEVDLTEISCRNFLTMDGDERDSTVVFYHGFINGKNNQTAFKISELGGITDQVVQECIDNPDAILLDVFVKYKPGS